MASTSQVLLNIIWLMARQCVLYNTRNKTLLLGTSLYKRYCSEVILLNQPYQYIGLAVPV